MFKTQDNIFEIAPQNAQMIVFENSDFRPMRFEDWHKSINEIILSNAVPESIIYYYDSAKNILLYSWYSYEMMPAAELYSYVILERALRIALNLEDKRVMLRRLMRMALEQGLINDSGFHIPRDQVQINMAFNNDELRVEYTQRNREELEKCTHYVEILCQSIPELRNYFAHDTFLTPYGLMTLRINAEIINMVFEKSKSGSIAPS